MIFIGRDGYGLKMGLDQFAYVTDEVPKKSVDFTVKTSEQFFYWRKHPQVQAFFERLYLTKGGTQEFNTVNVQVTLQDIIQFEKDLLDSKLPHTEGFFFGDPVYVSKAELQVMDSEERKHAEEEMAEQMQEDLSFIDMAKRLLNDGKTVYYSSWW